MLDLLALFRPFRVKQSEDGLELVVTGAWSDRTTQYVVKKGIKALILNYAFGWKGSNLSFLRNLPHLERLEIVDWNIDDISPIHDLHNLRRIGISTYCGTPIDFTAFPRLESCFLEWRSGSESLFQCRTLKYLYVDNYEGTDMQSYGLLANLESLSLANAPVTSLKGLAPLSSLTMLGLYNLRKLGTLAGIQRLDRLEELKILGCAKIERIDEIENLTNLRVFHLGDNKKIASLRPVANFLKLEQLIFDGSTNIEDGDMTVLLNLPSLQKTAFRNRKHYTCTCEEIWRALEARSSKAAI